MSLPTLVVEVGFGDTVTSQYLNFDVDRFDTGKFAPDFVGTDVSADVRAITIKRGRSRLLEAVNAGTCDIILDNTSGDYDPTNLSGPYVSAGVSLVRPMVRVKVKAAWAGIYYPLFAGYADAWERTWPAFGADAVTRLRCSDGFKSLARHEPGTSSDPTGAGELSGTRINRLLDNAAWPTGERDVDAGVLTMRATTLDTNTLSELQAVTLAEGGNLYVDRNGKVVFRGRHARIEDTRSINVQATFDDDGTDLPYNDIELSGDDDLIKNSAAGTRDGGNTQTFSNPTSIGTYGIRSYNVTGLWLANDSDVAGWVNWVVSLFGDYESRVESIKLRPKRADALWPVVLDAEFGDLILVNRRPTQGDPIAKYVFLEGMDHTIIPEGWETVWRFSSATGIYTAGATYLLFDNATAGKFDTGQLAPF